MKIEKLNTNLVWIGLMNLKQTVKYKNSFEQKFNNLKIFLNNTKLSVLFIVYRVE